MKISRVSMISGKTHELELDILPEQVVAYDRGVLLQDAFPNLTTAEREFYKTGITDEEWKATFSDGDDALDTK